MICGSPTPAFFSQIAFFRYSLNALGGDFARANLVAVFGADEVTEIPESWRPHFLGIDVAWATCSDYAEMSYNAQHFRRFEVFDQHADVVIFCDADVAPMSLCDEFLQSIKASPCVAGFIAHHPPPPELGFDWDSFSDAVISKRLPRDYSYTLAPCDTDRGCPFYVNYGVVISTPTLFNQLFEHQVRIRKKVESLVDPWWGAQISLAISCHDMGLPTRSIPIRYNFPNDPIADDRYSTELDSVVFMHYLRTDCFRRDRIFSDKVNFDSFLSQDLVGSNRVFRNYVKRITHGIYPFGQQPSVE